MIRLLCLFSLLFTLSGCGMFGPGASSGGIMGGISPDQIAAMMKTPEVQKAMIQVMSSPEMRDQMAVLLSSPEMQQVVLEVMRTPEMKQTMAQAMVQVMKSPEMKQAMFEAVKSIDIRELIREMRK